MKTKLMGAVALSLLAAACGTSQPERTTGGAAAGAATGAAVGALGGPVGALAGAGIGGAAGAITGATTSPQDVNLGRPLWNDPDVRVPGVREGRGSASAGSSSTRQLQQALAQRGFDPGPADGRMGPRTQQAIAAYQRSNNMDATGRADPQLYSSLGVTGGGGAAASTRSARSERDRAYMGGGMVREGDRATGGNTGMMGSGSGGMTGTMGSGSGGMAPRSGAMGSGNTTSIDRSGANSSLPRMDGTGGTTQGSRSSVEQNRDVPGTGNQ